MLAFSVREALRQAAAAFGPSGVDVELASPATPETVYWAIQAARRGGAERNGQAVDGAAVDGAAVDGALRTDAKALSGA
jgi:xanthine dehydrogenase large subunit